MLRRVALVGTDVSVERIAIRSTEMSVLTRATRRNILEDDIIHRHHTDFHLENVITKEEVWKWRWRYCFR
jgi:hypothetical protein